MIYRYTLFLLLICCSVSKAQEDAPTLIRDAEIEETLKDFMDPLLKVANLPITSLRLFILHTPDVNAATGSGVTLFINTGLIEKAKDAAQLLGVLAHETGHMAGSHVARFEGSEQNAQMILGLSLLGLAAGVLSNQADLAIASLLAGEHIGLRSLLKYSRTQEYSADQAGANYLKLLKLPLKGMVEFLELLQTQEDRAENSYNHTHPLTQERIRALELLIVQPEKPCPELFENRFQRIKAKIIAYTAPKRALKTYKKQTPLDWYAQSIAYFRMGKFDQALVLIDKLILLFPQDPYFHELKGQIFQSTANSIAAIAFYKKAVALCPENGLLKLDLGRLFLNDPSSNATAFAFQQFEEAKKTQEIENPFLWRQLSIVYRRQNNPGIAELCLAQEAVLRNDQQKAHHHATRALKFLKKSDPGYIKALDIKNSEL